MKDVNRANGTSRNGSGKHSVASAPVRSEKNSVVGSGSPARTLAKGHQSRRVMTGILCVSVLGNILTPLWFSWQNSREQKVVIFDTSSGSLLLSPLVDPASDKELVEITASWAARCLLNRSPAGFDDPRLLELLFLRAATEKADKEFSAVKQEYVAKNLRSKVEISQIKGQAVGDGMIVCRVTSQVIITGVVNGEAIQEINPTVIDFRLMRNPDLGRNRRYPLAVQDYAYVATN
jgi:hypothetical protein